MWKSSLVFCEVRHEENEERLEWLGGSPFDPEAFDLGAVNRQFGHQ